MMAPGSDNGCPREQATVEGLNTPATSSSIIENDVEIDKQSEPHESGAILIPDDESGTVSRSAYSGRKAAKRQKQADDAAARSAKTAASIA